MNKKIGKMALMAGIMMLVTSTLMPMSSADGMHVSDIHFHMYEPYQKAVIYWSGTTETMILSSAVRSDAFADIAWIVPIISTTMPNVTSGNMSIFEELVNYMQIFDYWPIYYNEGWIRVDVSSSHGVILLESKEVDIYDIVILKADNASDLINWLIENNFKVPPEAEDVLERYVSMDNCYFVVNKIDLNNKHKEVLSQIENGTITIDFSQYLYQFDSVYSFEQFKRVQALQILGHIDLTYTWYQWYEYLQPNYLLKLGFTQDEYDDLVARYSTYNSQFIAKLVAEDPRYVNLEELLLTNEILENYNAVYEILGKRLDPIYDYYQVRDALREGMATPLKFTFTPYEPYYPLTISSLNLGYGNIDVYVIAEHPVVDINKVLTVDLCKEVDDSLREKLLQYFSVENADFVTRLSYRGNLKDLTDDAIFSLYPLSKPDWPIFMHVVSKLYELSGKQTINGIAWDPDAEVIEIQYRIDNDTTWRVADGKTHWSFEFNTITLDDGNHTLYLRALRKNGVTPIYSQIYSFSFSTNNSNDEILSGQQMQTAAFLLTMFVVLSVLAVAIISRKTTMHR